MNAPPSAETMVVQLGDGKYAIGAGGNQETGYELWFSPLDMARCISCARIY